MTSREVVFEDGKVSVTYFFFKRFPGKKEERFLIEPYNGTMTEVLVKVEPGGYMRTPKGSQREYWLDHRYFSGCYDYDTGILIFGRLIYRRDALLRAFNITEPLVSPELYETNADLGPSSEEKRRKVVVDTSLELGVC